MARRPPIASAGLRALSAVSAAQGHYLLGLCLAAWRRAPARQPASDDLYLVVLVPAHDERLTIAAAVGSLMACSYPPQRREVIVIADNCSDETARLAREAGATAWERTDPRQPGKGRALAWALARLATERTAHDAVVMMDADCVADPDLLRRLAGGLASGADVVQGAFLGSNPDASRSAALRWAGYALMNVVRSAGHDRLGLSCGLWGSGMAFSAATLAEVPWAAFSVAEDKEQHLQLVWARRRVRFIAEAVVRSPMPTEQAQAETQQVRWESGNLQLARDWAPRLLVRGLRERDLASIVAGWDLLIPPLSLLVAANAGVALAGPWLGAGRAGATARRTLIVIAAYVFGGLAVARAPRSVFAALLTAPSLIVRRLAQYGGIARGRGHREWQRTTRPAAQ